MKNLSDPAIDRYRDRSDHVLEHWGTYGDSTCGAFWVPSPVGGQLYVIASSGEDWDHVSVSARKRCPTWAEMQHIARLFFDDGETAMQLHVPASEHIDDHPYCLHLWRPHSVEIPRPPSHMV